MPLNQRPTEPWINIDEPSDQLLFKTAVVIKMIGPSTPLPFMLDASFPLEQNQIFLSM